MATNLLGETGSVVGVVTNHNFASLHESIEPLVLEYNQGNTGGYLLICYSGNTKQEIEYIDNRLKEIAPADILEYTQLSYQWDSLFATEKRADDTFQAFTILALIISCIVFSDRAVLAAEMHI